MTDRASLPAWLEPWLAVISPDQRPRREPRSNCAACVMCSDDDWTSRVPQLRYLPGLRCCTYTPELVNFLVGGMLANPDSMPAPARVALAARIASDDGTPFGLANSQRVDDMYKASVQVGGFGRDPGLKCAFLQDDGRCGVWSWRNSVCATWHCRHARGKVGLGMWTAWRHLIAALEDEIGAVAMEEVAPGCREQGWSAWSGDRESLYLACWDWVRDADPRAVLASCSERVLMNGRVARRAVLVHERRGLPAVARAGESQVIEDLGDRVRIGTYTSIDALVVPKDVYAVLSRFDGRAIADVLAELESLGVTASEALVQTLFDFDVLV